MCSALHAFWRTGMFSCPCLRKMTLVAFLDPQELKLMPSKNIASSGYPTWSRRGEGSEPKTLRSPVPTKTEEAFPGRGWGWMWVCAGLGAGGLASEVKLASVCLRGQLWGLWHPGALWSRCSPDDTAQLFIVLLGLITKNKTCRVMLKVTGFWIRLSFLAINTFSDYNEFGWLHEIPLKTLWLSLYQICK